MSRPPKIADRLPEPRRETGRPAARLADETAATESTDDDSLRAAKSAPREEIDAYATQTFHIEVSAGRPQGAGETKIAPLHRVASDHRRRSDQQDQQLIQSEPRADAQVAAATIKTIASPRRRSDSSVHGDSQRRKRRRRVPPWLVSLYLHAVLLAVLALVTFASAEPSREPVLAFFAPLEPPPVEFPEVKLEPVDDLIADEAPSPIDVDPIESSLEPLDSNELNLVANQPTPRLSEFDSIGDMFEGSVVRSGKNSGNLGNEPTASFFGTAIEGRRIVFVLDNSGSMQGGRLETVIAELLRCVDALSEDQMFYVIFHSDTLYPLFYPAPVDRFISPNERNKMLLRRWLATVELCLGDSVDKAIAAAASISPDTVFLLSDGRIPSERKRRFLLDGRSRPFPIHTFGVGLGTSIAGRRNLEEVAGANDGEFRESDVPEEMQDLARKVPRPYHRDAPGPIWGPFVDGGR